jgi:hypothetical protein
MSQLPGTGFDALERDLALLASDVVFPETPSFAFPEPRQAPKPARKDPDPPASRWWQAGLAAAVLLIVTTVAIPDARHAAADWFNIPGIRIEVGDREGDPPATVTSIGGSLLLGQQVTLTDAASRAGFPVLVPGHASMATTPEVYLNEFRSAPVVSLIYPASADLPAIGTTGVGMLLMQIDASGDTPIMIVKRASGESSPMPVTVNGQSGYWIQGGVLMSDAGDPFWTYLRRSGNVLVWEQDGITYRMESNLPLGEAIAIAESLEPSADG